MNIGNPKLIKQLESLVDNRQDWLFRFAYIRIGQREDAEDIVQEVLLAAFKKLKEGQQVEELDRYIIRSVSNACRDYLRKIVRKSLLSMKRQAYLPAMVTNRYTRNFSEYQNCWKIFHRSKRKS